MASAKSTERVREMMDLGTLGIIFLLSIILCAVGAEVVKRYRPNINKMYILLLHLVYGVVVVFLYFLL